MDKSVIIDKNSHPFQAIYMNFLRQPALRRVDNDPKIWIRTREQLLCEVGAESLSTETPGENHIRFIDHEHYLCFILMYTNADN